MDFDEDGKKELVFSGLNNEYQTGCLVIFDNSELEGASPQKDDYYRCAQLSEGSEKHYILLPRIEWTLEGSITESASKFDVLQNRRLSVFSHFSCLYYEFDLDFNLAGIRTSHAFEMIHQDALSKGIIDFEDEEAFIQELSKKVLYYNGSSWTPKLSRLEKSR